MIARRAGVVDVAIHLGCTCQLVKTYMPELCDLGLVAYRKGRNYPWVVDKDTIDLVKMRLAAVDDSHGRNLRAVIRAALRNKDLGVRA